MDRNKNLKPLKPDTGLDEDAKALQRKIRQKGAEASHKVRKEKKKLRELVEMFGELPAPENIRKLMADFGIKDYKNNYMASVVGLFQKALKGDVQAFNAIRDIIGEKPVEKQESQMNLSGIQIGFVETGIEPAGSEEEIDMGTDKE